MTREEIIALPVSLPKWPQCIIKGKSIIKEQAMEIIRRTDDFFVTGYGGNNEWFNKKALRLINKPDYTNDIDWDEYAEQRDEWNKKWGSIGLNYLSNSWVSTAYIHGPNGWCHPDGTIEFHYNIGKWPSVEEVYDDLETLGKEFPFLELTLTLMNGEDCENSNEALISLSLKDGVIDVCDSSTLDLTYENKPIDFIKLFSSNRNYECYFPIEQIQTWADEVFKEDN